MEKDIWKAYTKEEIWNLFGPFEDLTSVRVGTLEKYFNTKFIVPTGSRHIEYPPKMETDDDYLILVPEQIDGMDSLRKQLVADGWEDCLDAAHDPNSERYKQENYPIQFWGTFRKGEVNIIVYMDRMLYEASAAATFVCKNLNVKDKDRRIRIFRWLKFKERLEPGDLQ